MIQVTRTIQKGNPEKLRQIRLHLGLSQEKFARRLGVALNTLSRWETGLIVPPRVAELAAGYLLLAHKPKVSNNWKFSFRRPSDSFPNQ